MYLPCPVLFEEHAGKGDGGRAGRRWRKPSANSLSNRCLNVFASLKRMASTARAYAAAAGATRRLPNVASSADFGIAGLEGDGRGTGRASRRRAGRRTAGTPRSASASAPV